MPAPLIKVSEMYAPAKYFETIGGFKPADFFDFLRKYDINSTPMGYPIFEILAKVNELRKERNASGSVAETYNIERINKIRLENAIKSKQFMSRELAIDRMRMTDQAVVGKIKYAIKMSAPRICGLQNVSDIEKILIETYNSAIEQLLDDAKQLISWEVYGIDFQQAGEDLVTNTQETNNTGDSIEDSGIIENEHIGKNRSLLDTVLGTNS